MKKYIEGQVFTLKSDEDIIIDDEEICTSKVCKISKGTKFMIEKIENDSLYIINFEGVGIATFTGNELNKII